MKNLRKLKTFDSYDRTNEAANKTAISGAEINERIKEVIDNILKARQYFMMLQDTVEHVYNILEKQIPPNKEAFIDTLQKKDQLLSDLIEDLVDTLEASTVLSEIEDINLNLKNLESYTDSNIDEILAGRIKISNNEEEDKDDDEFEDDEEEEEEDDDDYDDDEEPVSNMVIEREPEDQLRRKPKDKVQESFVNEQLKKKALEIEDFIKKHSKQGSKNVQFDSNKFKKGEIVYVNGITNQGGKFFNGKKFQIVCKSEDNEDSYDLYQDTKVGKEGEANIKGMPSKYIFRDKPTVITEVQPEKKKTRATKGPQIKERPRATKKPDKK